MNKASELAMDKEVLEELTNTVELYRPMDTSELQTRVDTVQSFIKNLLKRDIHYGKIKGCGDRDVLFLSGAQLLGMGFHIAPTYEVSRDELENGHREYHVNCVLKAQQTGNIVGQGLGACSSAETKYKYVGKGEHKKERDNPTDIFNTVLKMAKKRAYVDAILTLTAANDTFTQDLEEDVEDDRNGGGNGNSNSTPKSSSSNGSIKMITEPQRKRFYAITQEYKWSDLDVVTLLEGYGIASSKEIPASQYQQICERLEKGAPQDVQF